MIKSKKIKGAESATVSFEKATGELCYKLTNDYLFRAMLQKNKKVLKGLICSIIGMDDEDVESVEILNPIELGNGIEAKDFILDIRVLLNSQDTINLEMQVLNLGNWTERSLAYMCRSFDNLNSGQDYSEVKPVIQVSFLDFTLFRDFPEFFSTYMFMNIRSHIVYSDKLKMHVIDLNQIDKATDNDKEKGIHHWAKLFKAATWEEVKMLAVNNEYLKEAAETVYQLSAEEKIRMQCQAREDFYRQQKYIQFRLEKAEEIEKKAAELEMNAEKWRKEAAEMKKQNNKIQKKASDLEEIVASKDEEILLLKRQMEALKQKG